MAFCTDYNQRNENNRGEKNHHFGKRKREPARQFCHQHSANGADGAVKGIGKIDVETKCHIKNGAESRECENNNTSNRQTRFFIGFLCIHQELLVQEILGSKLQSVCAYPRKAVRKS